MSSSSSRRSAATCSFWLRGQCKRGASCTYAHHHETTTTTQRSPHPTPATPPAVVTLTNMPLDGNTPVPIGLISLSTPFPASSKSTAALIPHTCRGVATLPMPTSKLKLCSFFETSGICSRGVSCHYAHGRAQLKCTVCGGNAYVHPHDVTSIIPSTSHKPALSIRTIPSTTTTTTSTSSTPIPSISNPRLDAIQRKKGAELSGPADMDEDEEMDGKQQEEEGEGDHELDPSVMNRFVDISLTQDVHITGGILKLRIPASLTPVPIQSSSPHLLALQQQNIQIPPVVLCDNMFRANQSIENYMLNQPLVGLDMEWRPPTSSSQSSRVALIQLSSSRMIVLLRMHMLKTIPQALLKLLNRSQCVKAGVDIGKDLDMLRASYPTTDIRVSSILSLDTVYRCMDGQTSSGSTYGLASLAEQYLGVTHSKIQSIRTSNWERRDLSGEQISYAATDAWLSYSLAHALTTRKTNIRFVNNSTTSTDNESDHST